MMKYAHVLCSGESSKTILSWAVLGVKLRGVFLPLNLNLLKPESTPLAKHSSILHDTEKPLS